MEVPLYHLSVASENSKTGPIPVSTSPRSTCPDNCGLKEHGGCYAENYPMMYHWDKVDRGERGREWDDFLLQIKAMKKNQLWRHNQAGDLVGTGDVIDEWNLATLTAANEGRRGFTYTHYPMTEHNKTCVRLANEDGFVINLSADTLQDADEYLALGIAPVVVMLAEPLTKTPAGNKITVCPAQTTEYMTCAVCKLCQKKDRKAIVGFLVHGSRKNTARKVIEIKTLLKGA